MTTSDFQLIDIEFQTDAIDALVAEVSNALNSSKHITAEDGIVLRAGVGSGKTRILHGMMEEIAQEYDDVAFVFLTKSDGNLVEQSLRKLKRFGENIVSFYDIEGFVQHSSGGVEPHSCAVIGWDKLNKRDKKTGEHTNIQMKLGESKNFRSIMEENKRGDGQQPTVRIVTIIDEAHSNFGTISSDDIIQLIYPFAQVLSTATPKMSKEIFSKSKHLVEVPKGAGAESGVTKRQIVINDGKDNIYGDCVQGDFSNKGLMAAGLRRRNILLEEYAKVGLTKKPLIVMQVENDGSKDYFERTADRALEDAKDLGYDMDKLFVWTADTASKERDARINNLDYSDDYAIITKIAPSEGWDCTRAHILVKLRPQSGSETLDAQILGRIYRTTDLAEWLNNKAYQENDMLNAAFVYCNEETYNIDLIGLDSVSAKKTIIPLKEEFVEKLSQIKLYKEIAGARKVNLDEKNQIKEGIKKFLRTKLPYAYKNGMGDWSDDVDSAQRFVVKDTVEDDEMHDQISGESKSHLLNFENNISKTEIEDQLDRKIRKTPRLTRYRGVIMKAVHDYHDQELYPDGERGPMNKILDHDDYESRLQDLCCAIYNNFDTEFVPAVEKVFDECSSYLNNIIYDGQEHNGKTYPMWTPRQDINVSTRTRDEYAKKKNKNTKDYEKTYAYDGPVPTLKEGLDSEQEQNFIKDFMGNMDWWIKNGTDTTNDYCLTRGDGEPKHHRMFVDFICQKNKTLFFFEVKGRRNESGENETFDAERDQSVAEGLHHWLSSSQITLDSISASTGVDEIVGGIVKKIDGKWYIYIGSGKTYEDCDTSSKDWKLVEDFIVLHI